VVAVGWQMYELTGSALDLLPIYAREILFTGPWGLGLLYALDGLGRLAEDCLWVRLFPSLAGRDRLDPGGGARGGH
jgi:hypothetical protein